MNRKSLLQCIACVVLPLALIPRLSAQQKAPDKAAPPTEPAKADAKSDSTSETVKLSPFVVTADEDEGYAAGYTLAGTRIRTDVKDVGSSLSVITAKMLADTATTNATQLLVYTPNSEVNGQGGNFLGAGDDQYAGQVRYGSNRVRGLTDADTTRDLFLSDIPWDTYNVGRIDIQRGPNAILFGFGSPAGIINYSINHASFKNAYKVENKLDNFGSVRFSGDFNQVLIENQLALRVSLLDDDTKFRQEPAFRHDQRLFAAMRWDPTFLNRGKMTGTFEVNYETGKVEANLPRQTPPVDYLTPWFSFTPGRQASGFSIRQGTGIDATAEGYWIGNAADVIAQGGTMIAYNQNQSTSLAYPENVSGNDANLGNQFYRGLLSKGTAVNSKSVGKILGANINAWKNTYITDRSVFDSYNQLLDGDTKRENMDFTALNIALRQTFFDETFGYELAYDMQKVHNFGYKYLNTANYGIAIDVMGTLPGGIIGGRPIPAGGTTVEVPDPVNPNLGRAYVVGARNSDWNWSRPEKETWRATLFYDLNFKKMLGDDSTVAKIFGSNMFNALLSRYTRDDSSGGGGDYYLDDVSRVAMGAAPVYILNYLSTAKFSGTSAAGMNLPSLAGASITAPGSRIVYNANTISYSKADYNLLVDSTLDEANRRYTSADLSRRTVDTMAAVWQGYWFGGNLIPLASIRRDKSWDNKGGVYSSTGTFAAGAPSSNANGTTVYMPFNKNYVLGPDGVKGTVDSKTYSVVTHTPKFIRDKIGGIDVQLIYNQSENFQPSPGRTDIMNRPIPDPTGHTKEYGAAVTFWNDKLYLKVVHYETKQQNVRLGDFNNGNVSSIAGTEVWARSAATAHAGLKSVVGPAATGDNAFQINRIYGYSSSGNAVTFKPLGPWAVNFGAQGGTPGSVGGGPITTWQGLTAGEPPVGTTRLYYTQAELDATWAKEKAAIDAILNNPPPDDFITANGINRTNFFRPQGPGMFDYGNGAVAATVTGDTESEGTEYELVGNPIPGLTLSVNASQTKARRTSIAQSYLDYVDSRRPFFYGAAGDMRIWGSGEADNAVDPYTQNFNASASVMFRTQIDQPISKFLAATNSYVPEMHPWAFNAVANYTFQGGAMKNFNVGGGYRWQDKLVIGYPVKLDQFGNETYDLDNPYYGSPQDAIDGWIGYSHKLTKRLTWHIQLNARNIFANEKLIKTQANPDGSGAAYRIPEPRTITLTNTFEF